MKKYLFLLISGLVFFSCNVPDNQSLLLPDGTVLTGMEYELALDTFEKGKELISDILGSDTASRALSGKEVDISLKEDEMIRDQLIHLLKDTYGESYNDYIFEKIVLDEVIDINSQPARFIYVTVGADTAYTYQVGWEVKGYWTFWCTWAASRMNMHKIINGNGNISRWDDVEMLMVRQVDEANSNGVEKTVWQKDKVEVVGKAKYGWLPPLSGTSSFMLRDACVKNANNAWVKSVSWSAKPF